jgi:hypothetical protein
MFQTGTKQDVKLKFSYISTLRVLEKIGEGGNCNMIKIDAQGTTPEWQTGRMNTELSDISSGNLQLVWQSICHSLDQLADHRPPRSLGSAVKL